MKTQPRLPLWVYGIATGPAFLSAAILAGRHYSTNLESQISIGLIAGACLFVPLTVGLLALQLLITRLTQGIGPTRRSLRLSLVGLPPVLLLLAASGYSFLVMTPGREAQALSNFFGETPPSVRLAAYGYDRDFFGRGEYVILCDMDHDTLVRLMTRQGFLQVDVQADPDHWRPSLCNEIVRRLTGVEMAIGSGFECFSKETKQNRARVFWEPGRDLAVFLGLGKYPTF